MEIKGNQMEDFWFQMVSIIEGLLFRSFDW